MKTLGKIILRNAIPPFIALCVLIPLIYLLPELSEFQYILIMAIVFIASDGLFKEIIFKEDEL